MTTIKGSNILTLKVTANNVYHIKYDKISTLSIINYTEGSILISETNDFELIDNVGKYLIITDGNSYNDYIFYKSSPADVYIKTKTDGEICLVVKRW